MNGFHTRASGSGRYLRRIPGIVFTLTAVVALGDAQADGPVSGTMASPAAQQAFPAAVNDDTLDAQRAQQGVSPANQVSSSDSHITHQNNAVSGQTQGSVSLQDGALNGARGIISVIQNTGHNVAIQESMNVNVDFNP